MRRSLPCLLLLLLAVSAGCSDVPTAPTNPSLTTTTSTPTPRYATPSPPQLEIRSGLNTTLRIRIVDLHANETVYDEMRSARTGSIILRSVFGTGQSAYLVDLRRNGTSVWRHTMEPCERIELVIHENDTAEITQHLMC